MDSILPFLQYIIESSLFLFLEFTAVVGWVVVASLVLLRQFHLAVVAGSLVETRQPLNQSKTALRPGRYRAIGKMCRLGVPLASTGEGPPLLGCCSTDESSIG